MAGTVSSRRINGASDAIPEIKIIYPQEKVRGY